MRAYNMTHNEPQFHVVDRVNAQGEPTISKGVDHYPFRFVIYRHVADQPELVYGELIALCHEEEVAGLVCASLNSTCAFLNTMLTTEAEVT